ncbi:hypothetical protein OGAPHI_001410 [Ogataea philodendri]|uniref:mitogen-activated protein kinase kinase n=1 Tax=Ogataea philodendri TaxID=1378263 RepID=A0A9P8T895_9ASCO|nr:uncharacterized protein OGAPHI_001410 [Ogataea philodendri]KAH3669289.1 hypothetical protein OGAPHI_001410 [Ogataea philodendri]
MESKSNKSILKKIKHRLSISRNHTQSAPALSTLNSDAPALSIPRHNATHAIVYNPYGINNNHAVFEDLIEKREPSSEEKHTTLPYPTESPAKHVPEPFRVTIEDLEQLYQLTESSSFIGEGGSASIRKVQRIPDKKLVALKIFNVFKEEAATTYYKRVSREFIITKNLTHVHVATVYELVRLPVILSRTWGMVMDYYHGDLLSILRQGRWHNIPLNEKLCYFKQIVFGLYHLHIHDVVHLDLKPANILVEQGVLKITDFGCGDFGHLQPGHFESGVRLSDVIQGTPPYQSPEITRLRNTKGSYDPFKADLWSLGIMLFVILKGRVPFKEAQPLDKDYLEYEHNHKLYRDLNPSFSKDDVLKVPNKGELSQEFPHPQLVRLFWRLCDPAVETRMTLKQLFSSEYFQKIETCFKETAEDNVTIVDYQGNFVESTGVGKVADLADVEKARNCLIVNHIHSF